MQYHELVEQVHRLLLDNLPVRSNKTPSGWTTFDCPMCTDSRKRAGIIQSGPKISYHCFNCNYTTGWSPTPKLGKKYKDLAESLGASKADINQAVLNLLKHAEDLESSDTNDYVYSAEQFPMVDVPEGTVLLESLPDDHEVKQYVRDRNLLGKFPFLYFANDTVYSKRVVVPFMFDNQLIGWTGRHINPPNKHTPKYLSQMPPGGKYVFNIDKFVESDRDFVVVVEGVFDAISIDAVSVLGNAVTAEQAHLIDKLNKRVILCPDRDAPGKNLINQALELGWEVSFPPWHHSVKDAADAVSMYGSILTLESIRKYAIDNKIKAQVKAKLL